MEPNQNNPQTPNEPPAASPPQTPDVTPAPPVQPSSPVQPEDIPDASPVFPEQVVTPVTPAAVPPSPQTDTDPQMPPPQVPADSMPAEGSADKNARLKKLLIFGAPIIVILAALLIYLFPVASGSAKSYANKLSEQNLSAEDTVNSKLSIISSSSTSSQVDKYKSDIANLKNEYAKTVSERPKLTKLPLASLNGSYKLAKQTEESVKQYDQNNTELIDQAAQALNYIGVIYAEVDDLTKAQKDIPSATDLNAFATQVEALAKEIAKSAETIDNTAHPASFDEANKIIVDAYNEYASLYNRLAQAVRDKNTAQITAISSEERKLNTKLTNALKDIDLSQDFKNEVSESRNLGDQIQANLEKIK